MKRFKNKIWLSSPTMHGEELKYMKEAYSTNWMSTVGGNIDETERIAAAKCGCEYGVALSSGTAALHLAIRLAGQRLYGKPPTHEGSLRGKKVFCTDMTFDATCNPIAYEGGEAVFIDSEKDSWNMDPEALEKAFKIYPDVKIAVVAHLYGVIGKIDEIVKICKKHGALLIEDAAEAMGAFYKKEPAGSFGDYSVMSFNGNKIITGSSGGMFLTDIKEDADKIRKWSTQSRENAPWYQHEELGYNYRMSNVIAGVVRGQLPYLEEHIVRKKVIYERYKDGFKDLPVSMNPFDAQNCIPNYWLSCLLIDNEAMCRQLRSDSDALYVTENKKSCPTEILETLTKYNAEGRPIWKPMHLQPLYLNNDFITKDGSGRGRSNVYIDTGAASDTGSDIFERGLCLPSDNKMTEKEQDQIIEIVKNCFK